MESIQEVWHSAVPTPLFLHRHFGVPGPGLEWDGGDGYQRQFCTLLAV